MKKYPDQTYNVFPYNLCAIVTGRQHELHQAISAQLPRPFPYDLIKQEEEE